MRPEDEHLNSNIRNTDSFLSLLRHLIYQKKQIRKSFSLSILAKRAGISKSLLSLILTGKRKPTLSVAEKLSEAFHLRGKERKQFLLLAQLCNSRTNAERASIESQIMEAKSSFKETELGALQYKLIANPLYSILYVLCGMPRIDFSIRSLRQTLNFKYPETQIKKALEELCQLGLIAPGQNSYTQVQNAIVTNSGKNDSALYLAHQTALKNAIAALDLDRDQREFEALTVAIPNEKLKVVKNKIRDFLSELNEYLSHFDEPAKVYQLNLNVFPLTDKPKEIKNETEE